MGRVRLPPSVRRRDLAVLIVAATLAVSLAGCGAPKAVPAGIPVDENGDALPTLQGVVVDEAIRPLAGATVRLLATGEAATTDADGHYELRRPTLVAETALVTASLAGFETRTQQALLSGHTSATLDFILPVDPPPVARVDVLQHTGHVRCTARAPGPAPADAVGCEPDHGDSGEDPGPPAWIWAIEPDEAFAGLVAQVVWEAESPASSELHAWLQAPVAGGRGGEVYAEVTGPSPLRLELPEDVARALPRWTAVWLMVELPPGAAGAKVQQVHEDYASLFYVDPAPAGYTLG